MLFWHCIRRAASRADCTAGSSSATRMPMIVITTNNSTSVKPGVRVRGSGVRKSGAARRVRGQQQIDEFANIFQRIPSDPLTPVACSLTPTLILARVNRLMVIRQDQLIPHAQDVRAVAE